MLGLSRKVKAASIELAELERLKTDFIAITSHELRTPLGLILGHATFLRELAGEEYASQLDTIVKNASRLKEIVENISSEDNIQTGAARVRNHQVSLAKIAEDVILTFEDEAKSRNITLINEASGSDQSIDADGVKINIALSNLVKNAMQFTDSGGSVTIKAEEDSGYMKVSVSDTGIGIPARGPAKII